MKTLALAVLFAASARADEAPVLRADFDSPRALDSWRGSAARLVERDEGMCLRIETTEAGGSASRQIELPADRIAGKLVTMSALVRAEDVSAPPKHWNGVKVMLILKIDRGGTKYPQLPLGHGTFEWTRARHTIRVPRAVVAATLLLGLEKVKGRAWFDDIEIRTGRALPRGVKGKRSEVMFSGHSLPRLRGVMHGPRFDERNVRDLAEWGANQVRWQLNWTPMKEAEEWARDSERFDRWLEGALAEADRALDSCERHGIAVLLDLHCPPGGRAEGGVCRMFSEARYRDHFLRVWDRIAGRYRGRKVIYAYDLVNEPVEPPATGMLVTWRDLATEATKRIRAIDPGKPVVYEPAPWGGAGGFDQTSPLDLDRVIYSFHMYEPHKFTHQFRFGGGLVYPGIIDGEKWDRERLREAMLPAIDFQREFNVHIYVGEFSAIRWAPERSAFRYLRDLTELFEEYRWDWSYHAYREWQGWSVEHTTDRDDLAPSATPTERKKLLTRLFRLNARPNAPARR